MESITPDVIKFSDFPKWVSRGSTLINQNGFLIDMANLPPDICKTEHEWWHALIEWYAEMAPFVSKEDVHKAELERQLKKKGCAYCKIRRFAGFGQMKTLAADRKRRASMPERQRKRYKTSHKFYVVQGFLGPTLYVLYLK